ncbi:hypothetical protein Ocin01_04649 [Orchesella cincta]|uniref:C2H2-type domain-containing protein n=1 Tax=Orchesella cincta TaxID=48709 RepID=A0A1D2NAK9_ORCCI|nr:hypothetical protein Ocin01_04649 [Orchesella cincta]
MHIEVKKTLDATDNKKLVAHHLPVLHPENDNTDSESMVVVSVLLNAKQSQNDEVSKAIEMLRRNGVNCVYFTLNKDASNSNGTKNGESQFISEEILKAVHDNENGPESPEPTELNTEKKVSSPTISTTSDYAAPSDSTDQLDVHERSGAQVGDVGTSLPSSTTTEDQVLANSEKDGDDKFVDIANVQDPTDLESCTMPTLSPSPPVLFPQVSVPCDDQTASMLEPEVPILTDVQKPVADNAANRRKKRRKRMYPYVSRRKHRNKRKKVELPELEDVRASEISDVLTSETLETISSPMIAPASPKKVVKAKAVPSSEQPTTPSNGDSVVKNLDPYEFEDSDIDTQAPDFFDTLKLISRKPTSQKPAKSTPIIRPASSKKAKKRGTKKRSPRKRLIFSDNRAFSPDITDRGNSTLPDVQEKTESTLGEECNFAESCVQSISTINDTNTNLAGVSNDISLAPDITENDAKLVLPSNGQCQPLMHCDDDDAVVHADQASTSDTTKVTAIRGKEGVRGKKRIIVAQESSEKVQRLETPTKESAEKAGSTEIKEPLPIASNDSLPDTPDSMQLRRSSFYSSISRNVRTNLEKYLDGRPQDLKAPKRPKKIKNGFLLHHGDNFPDNPEAPYRLHLATQVLLKLNKRRAKCKPKEDKGKSLLSYLKLQPKRISRGGKHSKPPENLTTSNADEEPTTSVFSGDWTVDRKYICNICGQVENVFWDMVMHKGEVHPGIVVTHVELSDSPPDGFRKPPTPRVTTTLPNPPPCSKCSATFSDYSDLHRHIFECAGNAAMLEDTTVKPARKKKGKRKRGFKRRISSLPKKKNSTVNQKSTTNSATAIKSGEITKRRNSEVFKCGFCERFFKTEGWLKNHVSLAHSLPISIPLFKLSLPSRASISSRRFTSQMMKPNKQVCRET